MYYNTYGFDDVNEFITIAESNGNVVDQVGNMPITYALYNEVKNQWVDVTIFDDTVGIIVHAVSRDIDDDLPTERELSEVQKKDFNNNINRFAGEPII